MTKGGESHNILSNKDGLKERPDLHRQQKSEPRPGSREAQDAGRGKGILKLFIGYLIGGSGSSLRGSERRDTMNDDDLGFKIIAYVSWVVIIFSVIVFGPVMVRIFLGG